MSVIQPKSKGLTQEERKFTPYLWPSDESSLQASSQREDLSGSLLRAEGRGEYDRGETNSGRPPNNDELCSDDTDEDDLPIFLRKDIPTEEEDHVIHGALTELWSKRQRASLDLVQALSQDDSDRFEQIEHEMRQL